MILWKLALLTMVQAQDLTVTSNVPGTTTTGTAPLPTEAVNGTTTNSTSAPTCFDCIARGCSNLGTCDSNTKQCSCPTGFGGIDCDSALCGSLAVYNSSRPVKAETQKCSYWSGDNCNVCQTDSVCAPLGGLGVRSICNKESQLIGSKHFSTCLLRNTLLETAYKTQGRATVEKYAGAGGADGRGSLFMTIWLQNVPQFSCQANSCSQSLKSTNSSTFRCTQAKCTCRTGTAMCGGSSIDISSIVNSASGGLEATCSNSGECDIRAEFLGTFFPQGIQMECIYGECVDASLTAKSFDLGVAKLDSIGISLVAIWSFLLVCIIIAILMCIREKAGQKLKGVGSEKRATRWQLEFENLGYAVSLGGHVEKTILEGASGRIEPGKFVAIMGPSGSGKTTFLDILAHKEKCGNLHGYLTVAREGERGEKMSTDHFKQISGYVDQTDIHIPCLTVHETLLFSALTRLPEATPLSIKHERVETVMEQLGLTHVRNSRVGDTEHRGLSGGERKRLSVAVELVRDPAVLFVDEPTSGLDSFSALQVMTTLANLAKISGKTVVCTVHQPNSAIWRLFDCIFVLSRGRKLYMGPRGDVRGFLRDIGHPCPRDYFIADYVLDVAMTLDFNKLRDLGGSSTAVTMERTPSVVIVPSLKDEGSGGSVSSGKAADDDVTSIEEIDDKSNKAVVPAIITKLPHDTTPYVFTKSQHQGASTLTQIQQLFKRSFMVFKRNPRLFRTHIGLSLFTGVFVGLLYFRIDNSLGGIQNRLGSFFFIQAVLAFGGLSAISSLDYDRLLFIRERSNGFYTSAMPYFLSKVLFDLIPLRVLPALLVCTISYFMVGYTNSVGAFFRFLVVMVFFNMNAGLHAFMISLMIPDSATATLAAVMSLLFQMLFSGILINQVNIPSYIGWLQYLSFFKYSYEAAIANEASGLFIKADISGISLNLPASAVLINFGLDATAYYRDLAVTLFLFLFLAGVIYCLMHFKLRLYK